MNGRIGLLFSFIVGWALFLSDAYGSVIDVVFDIDSTCVYAIEEEQARLEPNSVVRIDKNYRLSDFLIETLAHLHSQKETYRISFFSGGKAQRNQQLVAEIYRKLNAVFPDLQARPHRVLHFRDLTRSDAPDSAGFAERYKKDLSKIGPDVNLERVVLVDDMKDFAPANQKGNMLWLGPTFHDILNYEAYLKNGATGPQKPRKPTYIPASKSDWIEERLKLVKALAVIETAREISDTGTTSFISEMKEILSVSFIPKVSRELTQKGLTLVKARKSLNRIAAKRRARLLPRQRQCHQAFWGISTAGKLF